jgi:hypothetical protein
MEVNMRQKNYTMRVLLAALVVSLVLAFVLPSNGQDKSSNTTGILVAGEQNISGDLTTGNWVLTDRRTEVFNKANVTQWSGSEQNLLGLCQWEDVLNIVHTISGGFKWEEPPRTMAPGTDVKFAVGYVNDEYSTDNKVLIGIKVRVDNTTADYYTASPKAVDVLKLTKDNKNYSSETKTVYFSAPKTLLGESNEIQFMVDCYIGQDHYVSTYTYTWTGDESSAK